MSERKPCIHCNRQIDANARICPFCNWDQSAAPSQVESSTPVIPPIAAPPAEERRWRVRIFGGLGFAVLMVVAFFVGSKFHGTEPKTATTETTATSTITATDTTATKAPSKAAAANVVLVPVAEGSSDASVPVVQDTGSVADGRTDASALAGVAPATQSGGAVVPSRGASVDPRLIGGVAYDNGIPARTAPRNGSRPSARSQRTAANGGTAALPPTQAPPAVAVNHTDPRPVEQPIPELDVRERATARLRLTVGTDGRVRDVEVRQTIPHDMNKLIASVQNWRFRPATDNGVPVVGHFTVDITFNGNH